MNLQRSRTASAAVLAAWLAVAPLAATSQSAPITQPAYPNPSALPLPIDRSAAGLSQSLQKLKTRASLMMVTAHPDDEDGGMLAYQSRGEGVDTTLLTLNRGESGQNVMSNDYFDQLGIMRTQELLAAGNYYGVHQHWTRVIDYGFSKTLEEALKNWTHERVLCDVVRQVRITRPLVITSVFAGFLSDGHGHHQTAGLMAQEAYKLAGDPNTCPDQVAAGLQPWSPLKVYARVPFARVEKGKVFDYATGKWEPVHFKNYVTDTYFDGAPSITVEIPEGTYNPILGANYLQIGRQGLSNQKSQMGGTAVPLAGPFNSPYHLYASRVGGYTAPAKEESMFQGIDTSLAGIASYAPAGEQGAWRSRLEALNSSVNEAASAFNAADPSKSAPALAKGLEQTRALLNDVKASSLPADAKVNMTTELSTKADQFNTALAQSLGLEVVASVQEKSDRSSRMGPMGGMGGSTPTYQLAIPGQNVSVNVHIANQGAAPVQIDDVKLQADAGDWKFNAKKSAATSMAPGKVLEVSLDGTVPENAPVTKPYFSRPNLEQSWYNLDNPAYLGNPTMPYPLAARVLYTFNGVQASVDDVVQTVERLNALGPTFEPLLIAPAISVRLDPQAGVIPMSGSKVPIKVSLRSNVKGPAKGQLKLNLPAGWTASPAVANFETMRDGEEKNVTFDVTPKNVEAKEYTISAVATYNGKDYNEGYTTVTWPGLRPYPSYRPATFRATGADVKTAPNLNVGYVMGTGEDVPQSLQDIGLHITQLSAQDISSGDLKPYDAIVIGIRAYANRPELRSFNNRILDYVKNGGVVVVEYQTAEYDNNYGPYPISVPRDAEKVVEEDSKVTILKPNDPLFNWPNKITTADFDNWVEERGHGFAKTWAPEYVALTEMHDTEQDDQKGGLLYAPYGKGYYAYMAYAFFRQVPDGVPGSYRIFANLLSASKNPQLKQNRTGGATPSKATRPAKTK